MKIILRYLYALYLGLGIGVGVIIVWLGLSYVLVGNGAENALSVPGGGILFTSDLLVALLGTLAIPTLAYIGLFAGWYLHRKTRVPALTKYIAIDPPSDYHPAVVGLLGVERIGPMQISASILKLLNAGFLEVRQITRGFIFDFPKRDDATLQSFEKTLLAVLRRNLEQAVLLMGRERHKKELFRKSVGKMYAQLYRFATELGFYYEDPHLVRRKFLFVGLVLYSFVFLMLGPVIVSGTYELLLPLLGTVIASKIFVRLGYLVPVLTPLGTLNHRGWLAFRHYLDGNPIPYRRGFEGTFRRYLPYATALGLGKDWIRRFQNFSKQPGWFDAWDCNSQTEFEKFFHQVMRLAQRIDAQKGPRL